MPRLIQQSKMVGKHQRVLFYKETFAFILKKKKSDTKEKCSFSEKNFRLKLFVMKIG
jgi:hypothetical protein